MADLRIDLAAEFVGKKAFKDADNAAVRLDKTVKKLGQTLGVTLGAAAMARYGKLAVKAFAEDEAAARRLAGAVDNLGLSFSKVQVADFIVNLERSAAISDDVLRPAFQSLLNITGSLTKSQELLNNAIQISRASGVDLATVTQDLGKGYVGITRGLIKYNTGLTRAELTTRSFNDILGIMLAKSAGAAQDYLTTTSYKMDVLRVASANAQETIGKGLVDAFATLGGGSSAQDAAETIDSIAKGINSITMAAAKAISGIRQLYKAFDFVGSLGGLLGADGALVRALERPAQLTTGRSASPAGTALRTRQQRDAEAAAAKRAKEMAALTKKQVASTKALTAEQKKQTALKKAATVFDLDQVQIIAALKGQVSDEDRKRLELQFALLVGNEKEASRLTLEIARAQGLGENLARFLASLPAAKNPFAAWEAYLDMLMEKAKRVVVTASAAPTTAPTISMPSSIYGTTVPNFIPPPAGTYGPPALNPIGPKLPTTNVPSVSGVPIGQAWSPGFSMGGNTTPGTTFTLKITGEGDITNAIAKGLQNQSLSTGTTTTINRSGGFL
jgi:hypothetical protein